MPRIRMLKKTLRHLLDNFAGTKKLDGGILLEYNAVTLANLSKYDSENGSLAEALIKEYFVSAPALLAEISAARKLGDWEAIADHAHSLRANSLTLGLEGVGAMCTVLESSGMSTTDQAFDKLTSAVLRGIEWLKTSGKKARNQVA